MLVKTLDTCLFRSETEHRVLDDVIRYTSLTQLATELRVLCDRKALVARKDDALCRRELFFELNYDGLFLFRYTHVYTSIQLDSRLRATVPCRCCTPPL